MLIFTVVDPGEERTEKINIVDVMDRLCKTTPTRFYGSDTTLYTFDNSLKTRYGLTEAPELIFTNKNLWEVLKEIRWNY